jgi:hypothetical protein
VEIKSFAVPASYEVMDGGGGGGGGRIITSFDIIQGQTRNRIVKI